MLGNDVVDLGDPETRPVALHPRFDERVFDGVERAALAASERPESLRWVLWAAKESAYKAARRRDPRTVFSPVRFAVRLDSRTLRGVVWHAGRAHPVQIAVEGECVHAVVTRPGDRVLTGVWPLGSGERTDPGAAVRARARSAIAERLGLPVDAVAIERERRVPVARLGDGRPDADLSLSHHGRYTAFACRIGVDVAEGSR